MREIIRNTIKNNKIYLMILFGFWVINFELHKINTTSGGSTL